MEVQERIKILRKELRLSQADFGERLGVSRAVINNLERGVLVNSNSITPLIKLISKEFSVSEEWLFHGESLRPEYMPKRGDDLYAELMRGGADDFEIAMLRAYFSLDDMQRKIFLQTYRDIINRATSMAVGSND